MILLDHGALLLMSVEHTFSNIKTTTMRKSTPLVYTIAWTMLANRHRLKARNTWRQAYVLHRVFSKQHE